ncbi:MAG: BTAD domain-containing putative transcriptional regulator [Chloroflexota bacterium]|nr:BTAD domain-containing putative transcriptional regulator [Chloroflexota bacterium]
MKRLNLYFMGTPRIQLEGRPVAIERHKAVALLAYLAVTERGHSRDWLATLLWPEVETSRAQLRIALSVLRQRIGDEWFETSHGEVGLRYDAIWTDVGQIKSTIARQNTKRLSLAEVDEAMRLYQYDLLAGFSLPDAPNYDAWQWAEEDKLRSAFSQLLHRHIDTLSASRQTAATIPYAQRLVELDPLNEESRRLLIQLYIDTNQRHQALLEYHNTQTVLLQGLGLEPEPATQALYERIHQSAVVLPEEPHVRHSIQAALPIPEPLIGREKELEMLVTAFANHERLITISGPSGIGKTHLAIVLGHRIQDELRYGAYFISFASPVTGTGLLEMLTRVLQLPPLPFGDMLGSFIVSMQSRPCVIILDNFEPADGAASVIQALLETAPFLSIVVTSQGSLSLKREFCFPLQGLNIAASTASAGGEEGAVELFLHSARHINAQLSPDPAMLDDVRRICVLAQGMPLAIVLAAAWCDVLQPREIVDEIAANYDFLRTDYLDVPERHRSIRAVFDAVWARLTDTEQQALLCLAVFRGGFSRHAAQVVSQVPVSLLKVLVTKSLISYSSANQRYVLHDLLRQYLDEHCDEETLRVMQRAHCDYFAEYAAARERTITGHQQSVAWRELDLDLPNLRAAWGYALGLRHFTALVRMIEPLRLFFQLSGLWEQGLVLFEQARHLTVEVVNPESQWLRTKLLSRLYADDGRVGDHLMDALASAKAADDAGEVAHIQTELGWRALMDTHYADAVTWFENAMRYYEHHPNAFAIGLVQKGLAYAAVSQFRREAARQHMQISLKVHRSAGDLVGEYELIVLRGELHLLDGMLSEAKQDLFAAFTYFSKSFSYGSALLRVVALGWVHVFLCEWDEAFQHIQGLLSLSSGADFIIVRACGVAMKVFANVLQGDKADLERSLDQLSGLSIETLSWPSTINRDLRFMTYLALLYGNVVVKHWSAAQQTLRATATEGYLKHERYRLWLAPLLAMFMDEHRDHALNTENAPFAYRSGAQHKWSEVWITRYGGAKRALISAQTDADDEFTRFTELLLSQQG